MQDAESHPLLDPINETDEEGYGDSKFPTQSAVEESTLPEPALSFWPLALFAAGAIACSAKICLIKYSFQEEGTPIAWVVTC